MGKNEKKEKHSKTKSKKGKQPKGTPYSCPQLRGFRSGASALDLALSFPFFSKKKKTEQIHVACSRAQIEQMASSRDAQNFLRV